MARTPSRRAFRQINPTRNEMDEDLQQILADIRGHMPGGSAELKRLAEEAGLARSTVDNLAWAETKSPHLATIVRVMKAVGKLDVLMAALKSEKPVTVKQAKARKSARDRIKVQLKDKVHPHRTEKTTRSSARRANTFH